MEKAEDSNEEKSSFECHVCRKVLSSSHNLKHHISGVHEKVRYGCNLCPRRFFRDIELKRHLNSYHLQSNIKRFSCDKCSFETSTNAYLNSHIRMVHRLEKTIPCDHCEKKFRLPTQLKQHWKNDHTGERIHKCPECDLSFLSTEYRNKQPSQN